MPTLTAEQIATKFGADAPIIGLFGVWYDVGDFVSMHPGGDVIRDYFGSDATVVFKVWHSVDGNGRSPLYEWGRWMKAVGKYKVDLHPLDRELLKFHRRLLDEGQYETDNLWLLTKMAQTVSIFVVSAFGARLSVEQQDSYYFARFPFAVLLAMGWQQCGFLMHDAMHSILVRDYKTWRMYRYFGVNVNHFVGWIFGSTLFGVNSNHWRRTHDVHHVLTNTIDDDLHCIVDPQMSEALWMTTSRAFTLSGDLYRSGMLQPVQDALILQQKWLWLPICVLLGRFGILIESWKDERAAVHLLAVALHHLIVAPAFYRFVGFENVVEFALFYFVAAVFQGVLTLQLLVSHYDKPYETKREHIAMGWLRRQTMAVKDIETAPHFDWFFGGLQFHLIHHALPKLPRRRYRKWSPVLKRILKKHSNIEVDTVSFAQSITDTIHHLGTVAEEYGIWRTLQEFHIE